MGFFTPLRLIAMFFIGVAVGVLVGDVQDYWSSGVWSSTLTGEAWAKLHFTSLNGFQVVIQREEYLNAPWLWNTVVTPFLLTPLWTVPLAIGVLLLVIKQVFFRSR
ncbi:MAG: hypothetical protein ACFB6R_05850 [Alphaproteobacteria bacterium]